MIDLHLHTNASDGTCTPEQLVSLAEAAGLRTIGITDHDTMAGVPGAQAAARKCGMEVVRGIEITSVHEGRDVHVLGYHVDPDSHELGELVRRQGLERESRAREIAARLEELSAPINIEALLGGETGESTTVARPQIARALVAAGHVDSVAAAFEQFLGEGCPAYVPHRGVSPFEVVSIVARAGGVTSLAHPGQLNQDGLIPPLCEAGLNAIEAYHSAHTPELQARYLSVARAMSVAVTGGSDFHGPNTRRSEWFGKITLPPTDYRRLQALAAQRRYDR